MSRRPATRNPGALRHRPDCLSSADRHNVDRVRPLAFLGALVMACSSLAAHAGAPRDGDVFSRQQLRSQRFWDAMNAVDEQAIRKIETALSQKLVEEFGIDVRCLCFDCTNFDTFIDSRTTSELAQRGHAKSKRTDLRVVGLALLV